MPRTEQRDLWITIGIILSLAVYHLWSNVSGVLNSVLIPHTRIPLASVITNMLFFWTVAALWVAYRRWTEVAQHEQEYRDILESTGPAAVIFLDERDRIVDCSESVEVMLGYAKANVLMKSIDSMIEMESDGTASGMKPAEAVEKLGFHVGEGIGRRSDGTVVPVEMIRLARKTTGGNFVLLHDISARKVEEARLRKAVESAERTTQTHAERLRQVQADYEQKQEVETLRENLLQMSIQDLIRPLQGARSGCEMLAPQMMELLDQGRREELEEVIEQMRRATMMVQSIVDVRGFEMKKAEIKALRSSPEKSVREAVEALGALSRRRQVEVSVAKDAGWAVYDADMIRRVIDVLLDNALRHTPEGGKVLVSVSGEVDRVRFSVMDPGPRIPANLRSKIFGAFNLLSMPQKSPRRPRGLCLAFCKMAVDAHQGEIGADVCEEGGMTFWFTLPRAAPGAPAKAHVAQKGDARP